MDKLRLQKFTLSPEGIPELDGEKIMNVKGFTLKSSAEDGDMAELSVTIYVSTNQNVIE